MPLPLSSTPAPSQPSQQCCHCSSCCYKPKGPIPEQSLKDFNNSVRVCICVFTGEKRSFTNTWLCSPTVRRLQLHKQKTTDCHIEQSWLLPASVKATFSTKQLLYKEQNGCSIYLSYILVIVVSTDLQMCYPDHPKHAPSLDRSSGTKLRQRLSQVVHHEIAEAHGIFPEVALSQKAAWRHSVLCLLMRKGLRERNGTRSNKRQPCSCRERVPKNPKPYWDIVWSLWHSRL